VAVVTAAITCSTLIAPLPVGAAAAAIPVTGRVNITAAGAQAAGQTTGTTALSVDGRHVAFSTTARLVTTDTNANQDTYLRDRVAGTVERVSLTDADGQIGGDAELCGMTRDARYVAFVAYGNGLAVPAQTEVYLRDRVLGTTKLVSASSGGAPALPPPGKGVGAVSWSDACALSDDGRYVAFVAYADNLVPGDANDGGQDVYRRDVQTGTTIRASVSTGGAAANEAAFDLAMTADGNTIAFGSGATNLVAGDTNASSDIFLRTVSPAGTVRISTKANGAQVIANAGSPAMTPDGSKIAFASSSSELVAGDPFDDTDIFVKTKATGAIKRASVQPGGQSLGGNAWATAISDDGTKVAFTVRRGTGGLGTPDDVYLRDLTTGVVSNVSATPGGGTSNGTSEWPAISGDGRAVAFRSSASNLVRKDTNGVADAFVRDAAVILTPFGSTQTLVTQQYADFEGRAPTAAELAEWKARIVNGERTPDQVIDDFAHGATFAGKRAPMIRLYWAFFLRAPDQAGLDHWTKKLSSGTTLAKVAKHFAASSEFQSKYGSKSNVQFVTLIYQNIFDRDPDPQGRSYWTKKLDSKTKTRGDVMVNFSESSEGKRVLAPLTDTILHVLGMLRTMPSKAYLDLTLGAVKGTWVSPMQVASIRASGGYAARIQP
jgi:Tol biopolymer transport system component